ncbi:hypothetical protein QR680_009240 [Steinernema hermaphroditum]|uniref:Uncharacterized protein n=1 Tax=Steinernema hermaphroditum TaxID=289476 RepID=A0AA39M9J4_9BILA|nr:hypothetical protein QR680_009240 [Steinernema hermaphroditum]
MHHQAILLITDNLKEYIDNLETIYLQHRGVVESVEEFSPRTNITKMLQTAKDAAVLKEKLTNTITLIESHCDLFHLLIAGAGAEERSSLNERFQALRLKTTTEHSLLNRRALTQQALLWRDDIEKVEDKIITHLSLKDRVRSDNNDKHTSRKRQTTSNKSPTKRRMTSTVGKVIINGKANACVFCGENHFSSDYPMTITPPYALKDPEELTRTGRRLSTTFVDPMTPIAIDVIYSMNGAARHVFLPR